MMVDMNEGAVTAVMPDASVTEDGQAITRALAGDTDAFAVIVTRYTERAYRMALYILGSEQDAMDVSQEAFIRAYRFLKRFDVNRPFFPWFARILRNLCYNFSKRRTRKQTYNIDDFKIASPRKGVDADTKQALNKALSQLSLQDREIIGKFYFEQLSYAEIAEELEIPVGTVMSRLYYARKHLKDILLGGSK